MGRGKTGHERVLTGAYGWRHAHWAGGYYPDDLPAEWRLQYYSNELDFVMVPASEWRPSAGFDCDDWLADTHDRFRFCVELPLGQLRSVADCGLLRQQLSTMGEKLHSLVCPPAAVVEEIREALDPVADLAPVFGLSVESALPARPVWTVDRETPSPLAILHDDVSHLRQSRTRVERFLGATGNAQRAIVVQHPELQMHDLLRFRAMLDIMGL